MNQNEFRQAVKMRTDIEENDRADEVIAAVLSTLSQRINSEEAHHLSAQIPEPYKTYVDSVSGLEIFDVDEYFERVAGKLRFGRGPATRYSQAVMKVINKAVTTGELRDVCGQLPADYDILFQSTFA